MPHGIWLNLGCLEGRVLDHLETVYKMRYNSKNAQRIVIYCSNIRYDYFNEHFMILLHMVLIYFFHSLIALVGKKNLYS